MSEKQETFTPGPWTTSRSTHGTWIESKSIDGNWSKQKDGNYAGRWAGHVVSLPDHMEQDGIQCGSIAGQDKTQGEIDANARLIAAAPELLEQCKLFEKLLSTLIMEGHSGADLERDNLQAILDKVEGETV